MPKTWSYLNLSSVLLVLVVNGASQSGLLGFPTVGEVSRKFDTLFTPSAYAFSIWGLIFTGLLGFALYTLYRSYRYQRENEFILRSGPWFVGANLLNAAWVVVFVREWIGLSLLIMFLLLACLVVIIRRLNMERWDAPIGTIAFVWWPVCLYSGWISVAAIANAALYLNYLGWNGGDEIGPLNWTIALILVAIALNAFMVLSRNMREFAAVGIWALVAIALRHQDVVSLFWIPLAGASGLGLLIAWHGYENRATNPWVKLRQRFTHTDAPDPSNTD